MFKKTDPLSEIELIKKLKVVTITSFRKEKKIIISVEKDDGTISNLIYCFTDEKSLDKYDLFNRALKKRYYNIF